MKRGLQIITCLWLVVWGVPIADALIIESPKEGQTIVVGEPIEWKIRPAPGEVCKSVAQGAPFNKTTGRYEWTDAITPNDGVARKLGQQRIIIMGEEVEGGDCLDATVTVNVVLPSTTTLQKIKAKFTTGQRSTLLSIYRSPKGDVLDKGDRDIISVSGLYSDGVERQITTDALNFISADEKVAVVGPHKVDRRYAVATPMGAGETEIIIKHGALSDRLTVEVIDKNCPEPQEGVKFSSSKCKAVFNK